MIKREENKMNEEKQYPEFTKGEKVIDRYGSRHTVLVQRGCQVFTTDGGWIHPSNLGRTK